MLIQHLNTSAMLGLVSVVSVMVTFAAACQAETWDQVEGEPYSILSSRGASAMTSYSDPHGDSTVVYIVDLEIKNNLSLPLRVDSIAVSDSVSGKPIGFEYHGIQQSSRWPRKGVWDGNTIEGKSTRHLVLSTRRTQAEIRAGEGLESLFGGTSLLVVDIHTTHGTLRQIVHEYITLEVGETQATKAEKELLKR